ncbi:MAG: hypothetical protein ACXACF_02415, partial [Candidatus Hermodarchaeia archaeon]
IQAFGFTPASFDEALGADCVLLIAPHQEYRDALNKLEAIQNCLVDTTNILPKTSWKVGRKPST